MAARIIEAFPRLHSVVIGPGLGRNENALKAVTVVIKAAMGANLP